MILTSLHHPFLQKQAKSYQFFTYQTFFYHHVRAEIGPSSPEPQLRPLQLLSSHLLPMVKSPLLTSFLALLPQFLRDELFQPPFHCSSFHYLVPFVFFIHNLSHLFFPYFYLGFSSKKPNPTVSSSSKHLSSSKSFPSLFIFIFKIRAENTVEIVTYEYII